MVIDLIRHGTPVGGSKYRGHAIDDPLTEQGWQQMYAAIGNYNYWDRIISSPMHRCLDFAEQLSEQHSSQIIIQ